MMYDAEDEYGLETFFPASLDSGDAASALHSSETKPSGGKRAGADLTSPSHIRRSAWRAPPTLPATTTTTMAAATPTPLYLSSTEVRPTTQLGNGKRALALPVPAVANSRPNSRTSHTASTRPRTHQGGETNTVRAPSRGADAYLLDYESYMMGLDDGESRATATAAMEVSVAGTSYPSMGSGSYQSYAMFSTETTSQMQLGADVFYPKAAPSRTGAREENSGQPRVTTAANPPLSLLTKTPTKVVSSFFTHVVPGGDDGENVEPTDLQGVLSSTDSESHGSASRGGAATSMFDGSSLLGDQQSRSAARSTHRRHVLRDHGDVEDDEDRNDKISADADLLSSGGASWAKARGAPTSATGSSRWSQPSRAPAKTQRGVATAGRSGDPPQPPARAWPETTGACGETFFERRIGTGTCSVSHSADRSGRMSDLEASIPRSSQSSGEELCVAREMHQGRGGGHHSVTEDARIMAVLKLTSGAAPRAVARDGNASSHDKARRIFSDDETDEDVTDGTEEDSSDEGAEEEEEQHEEAEAVASTNTSVHSRRTNATAPARSSHEEDAQTHRRLARPAPSRSTPHTQGKSASLPPMTDASVLPRQPRQASRTDTQEQPQTSSTAATMRGQRGASATRARGAPPLQPQILAGAETKMAAAGGGGVGMMNTPMWGMNNMPMMPNGPFSPVRFQGNGSPRAHPCSPQRIGMLHARRASMPSNGGGGGGPVPMGAPGSPLMRNRGRSATAVQQPSGGGNDGVHRSRSRSVASSVVSSVPSLHASDRFDAVADLRQFITRRGPIADDVMLGSPPIEDLDVLIEACAPASSRPSAIAPPSIFTNVGDEWFTHVTSIISWVPSPQLTPDSRPLR